MLENVFSFFAIFGVVIICILAFTIPKNPFKLIPTMSVMGFDKPIWFCIIICGSFFYLVILCSLYKTIKK